MHRITFTAETIRGVRFLRFSPGRWSVDSELQILTAELKHHLTAAKHAYIAFDMRDVGYLSSMAQGILIELQRLIKDGGQVLILVQPSPAIRETLELTRLDRVFPVMDSPDELLLAIERREPIAPRGNHGSSSRLNRPTAAEIADTELRSNRSGLSGQMAIPAQREAQPPASQPRGSSSQRAAAASPAAPKPARPQPKSSADTQQVTSPDVSADEGLQMVIQMWGTASPLVREQVLDLLRGDLAVES